MSIESKKMMRRIERHIAKDMTALTANVVYSLFAKNPKDTGFSRSSWFSSKGAPLIIDTEYGVDAVEGQKAKQDATLAKIKLGYRYKDGTIYITNNASYIGELERGTSTKAPNGFIKQSIAAAILQTP